MCCPWPHRLQDASAVQEQGPPKSVTVEDSFKSCASFAAAEKVRIALEANCPSARVEKKNGHGGGVERAFQGRSLRAMSLFSFDSRRS